MSSYDSMSESCEDDLLILDCKRALRKGEAMA